MSSHSWYVHIQQNLLPRALGTLKKTGENDYKRKKMRYLLQDSVDAINRVTNIKGKNLGQLQLVSCSRGENHAHLLTGVQEILPTQKVFLHSLNLVTFTFFHR